MSAKIHPTASGEPGAISGDGVILGPYTIVEADV